MTTPPAWIYLAVSKLQRGIVRNAEKTSWIFFPTIQNACHWEFLYRHAFPFRISEHQIIIAFDDVVQLYSLLPSINTQSCIKRPHFLAYFDPKKYSLKPKLRIFISTRFPIPAEHQIFVALKWSNFIIFYPVWTPSPALRDSFVVHIHTQIWESQF